MAFSCARVAARRGVVALSSLLLRSRWRGCAGCRHRRTRRRASPAPPRSGSTIAFESIDGPPPEVFDRLVDKPQRRGAARGRSPWCRATGAATYRVRGYLAAQSSSATRPRSPGSGTSTTPTSAGRCASPARSRGAGSRRRDAWAAADEAGAAPDRPQRHGAARGLPQFADAGRTAPRRRRRDAARRPRRHAGGAGIFRRSAARSSRPPPPAPQAALDVRRRRRRPDQASDRARPASDAAARRQAAADRRCAEKASGQRNRAVLPRPRAACYHPARRSLREETRDGGEKRSDQARRRQFQSRARRRRSPPISRPR